MLTDLVVKGLKPKAKGYKRADVRGLYVYVSPAGGKLWRFDYRWLGKRKTLSFGAYPDVTLEAAHDKLHAARQALAAGRDPGVEKREATRRARSAESFEQVGGEWLASRTPVFSPATLKKTRWILDGLLIPAIGTKAIGAIEPPDVLAVLQAIERRGQAETAHRAGQVCGQILRYAIATGRATRDASADLKGALRPIVVTSHAAITDPAKVGALLRAIDASDASPVIHAAMRLAPLVFVRPGELRTAEWAHVDLAGALWRIPAEKMKMRADHLVPLSTQALAILTEIQALTGKSRYVFPSSRSSKRPLSAGTLNAVLRRLGYESDEMTPHGFRAMARTLLDERLRIDRDVIELQLAHTVPGALGNVYNRSRHIERRIEVMQMYADYLDTLRRA